MQPLAAFEQMLLALKIYRIRYVHYRFSALIASARTQPLYILTTMGCVQKPNIIRPRVSFYPCLCLMNDKDRMTMFSRESRSINAHYDFLHLDLAKI